MRIALLSQAGSVHTTRWSTGLVGRGHTIRLFSNSSIKITPEGVDTVFLPGKSSLSYLRNIPRIRSLLKEFKPDIVHAHFATGYGLWGAYQSSAPTVLTVWGSDIEFALESKPVTTPFVRRALRRANMVTSASRFLLERAIVLEPSIKDKGRRVPFGVPLPDLNTIPARDATTAPVRLIFAKQFMATYAPDLVVEAYAKALAENPWLHLTMIGGGPDRAKLERMARELGLGDKIVIEGWQSIPEAARRVMQSDIMIMPSHHESFGVAALEAASYALPVIATRVGGVPEIIHDGVNGILIEAGDVSGLTDAILRLAGDSDLRVQMGRAGRKIVEEEYTLDSCLEQMEGVYAEVLGN